MTDPKPQPERVDAVAQPAPITAKPSLDPKEQ